MIEIEEKTAPVIVDINGGEITANISSADNINITVGENAKIDAAAAVNYIVSGQVEIAEAVADGVTYFNAHAAEKTLEFDNNADEYVAKSRNWATKTNGMVDGEDYSAKYYANMAEISVGNMANRDLSNLTASGEAKFTAKQDALVSGSNIKTINGSSVLGSGDLVIATGDNDNISITKNASDKLQTVGVINQNAPTTVLKQWTGTKAQYNAIVTKDSNTLYNITDDESSITTALNTLVQTTQAAINTMLNSIYPVGSIYITVSNDNPATLLGLGTWNKVSEGRVLQGSDSGHNAGTTIEAGLPNITGAFAGLRTEAGTTGTGAFQNNGNYNGYASANGSATNNSLSFDASRSSSIYGNSSTVQPPAFVVNIWERIA